MSDTMHVSDTVQPRTPHQTRRKRSLATTTAHRGPCVPREFVHRPHVGDVLVTSWQRHDNTRFSLTAQWPHDHSYFTPVHGRHHLILPGESIRQAGLLLCHSELGVPVGHHFVLGDLVYTTHPEHLAVGRGPTLLTIDVNISRMRLRSGKLSSGHFAMTFRKEGRIVATGHSEVTVASPAVYRRIRGERISARRRLGPIPPAVPHRLTGSAQEDDVLLSPTDRPDRWQLRVAPGHAAVVNPANDHIPGMLLLDAAQQAARTLTAPETFVPYAFGTEFHRYAEHHTPCIITAQRIPSALPDTTTVQVIGTQNGEPVFVSALTALDTRI
ncbi:ScbA/BarX family gamma-butyrolactone biosynthesis protein [Streptomyces sp. NPDC101150]|uniref:ScbA/BarX family gamma-butyrolactone biosynthesis protein n=1 Tax=Streptomyces sp. NPDC101150 TaxID=3366114 RepID=UPI0038208FD8